MPSAVTAVVGFEETMNALKEWILKRREARAAGSLTPASARERARRGALYLDDVAPGWFEEIDLWSLDLADGGACVLGQLHGSFSIGLGRAGIFSLSSAPRASFSPVDLGFHCVQGVSEVLQEQDHVRLTRAWNDEVRRRAGSTPQSVGAADTFHSRAVRTEGDHILPESARGRYRAAACGLHHPS